MSGTDHGESSPEPPGAAEAKITGLFRYPVKGCAGVPVASLELDEIGPVGDRRWMIVTPDGTGFLSQRRHPTLALVRVRFGLRAPGERPAAELSRSGGASLTTRSHPPVDGGGIPGGERLRLEAPGMSPIEVDAPRADADLLPVRIWRDEVEARPASDRAAEWLSDYLKTPARLVRLPDDVVRSVEGARAEPGFPARVALADAYPLLLLSTESVEDLVRRLPPDAEAVGVERFRPNVVVSGGGPWAEDRWRRISAGSLELAVGKPCARCATVTVHPETGKKGPEPLTTLATFRNHGGAVYVGQNALHRGPGVLTVGTPIAVLAEGDPRPPLAVGSAGLTRKHPAGTGRTKE